MKLSGHINVLLVALKGTALFLKVGFVGSLAVIGALALAIFAVTDAISGYLVKRDEFDDAGNARTGQIWVAELARMWKAAGDEVSRFLGLQWEANTGDETDMSGMTDRQRKGHMAFVRMQGEINAAKERAVIQDLIHLFTPIGFVQDMFAPIDFNAPDAPKQKPLTEQMMSNYNRSTQDRLSRMGSVSKGDFKLIIEGAPKGSRIAPVQESGPSKLFPMFDMGTRLGL